MSEPEEVELIVAGVGGQADLADPKALAQRFVARAVERLGELMEESGRQSRVALGACVAIIKLANPEDEEKIMKAVEVRLQQMLDEAMAQRERAKALPPVTP